MMKRQLPPRRPPPNLAASPCIGGDVNARSCNPRDGEVEAVSARMALLAQRGEHPVAMDGPLRIGRG
eukprot:5940152-Pyramimonas_sp.AAC.1